MGSNRLELPVNNKEREEEKGEETCPGEGRGKGAPTCFIAI